MNELRVYQVIKAPHFTEKAAIVKESNNQVVFKVATDATKLEVKRAVEKLWSVKVDRVQLLNVKGKVKRTMRGVGKRADWKKAYVRLAEGHDIDFTSAE